MAKLAEIVTASQAVAATRSRKQKVAVLADLLRALAPEELRAGVGFLCGELRQGKLGIGYATLRKLRSLPAGAGSLDVLELDGVFSELSQATGKGSATRREQLLSNTFAKLTDAERDFVTRLVLGELRQGALEAILLEAVALAGSLPPALLRRAMLFAGDATEVAVLALQGDRTALEALTVELFRPLRPMLAQTAKDVSDAFERTAPCAFEQKLDGARIQVHRSRERVEIYSRQGNPFTDALPELVALARGLPCESVVLDGEAIALRPDGRPQPFQITMQRVGRKLKVAELEQALPVSAFFFDCLYLDGEVLVERTNAERWAALERVVPPNARVVRSEVSSVSEAEAVMQSALERGHEGVVVKSLASTYESGRRGAGWLKLKPAPTLDLVVLAVEWGSGRRQGLLSNLHLGARDPDSGGFVMLGKTFKGLTDELLRWQTAKLTELATNDTSNYVVHVRPELVVEIAFDGLQKSRNYPGGLALRFARVRRYREDKLANEADTISFVRSLYERTLGA